MLRARRRGVFKRVYDVDSGGEPVTELTGVRREGCTFSLGGDEYRIERVDRRTFRLSGADGRIASAERETGRAWAVRAGSGNLKLVKPSIWRSHWEVHQRGVARGEIRQDGWFKRTVSADVPPDVPPPVAVLTLYVVLVIFERQAAAAASGA